nr:atherin-like [Macaca fascicularis]
MRLPRRKLRPGAGRRTPEPTVPRAAATPAAAAAARVPPTPLAPPEVGGRGGRACAWAPGSGGRCDLRLRSRREGRSSPRPEPRAPSSRAPPAAPSCALTGLVRRDRLSSLGARWSGREPGRQCPESGLQRRRLPGPAPRTPPCRLMASTWGWSPGTLPLPGCGPLQPSLPAPLGGASGLPHQATHFPAV